MHRCTSALKDAAIEEKNTSEQDLLFFSLSLSLSIQLQFLSMLNEWNDGPVHRPSLRLIGMLIASRADLEAISKHCNELASELATRRMHVERERTWM